MVDYDDESISIFSDCFKKITLALRQSGANLTHGKDYLMAILYPEQSPPK
jgi:hypothetical protein